MKSQNCKCLTCEHAIDLGEAQDLPTFHTSQGVGFKLGFRGVACVKQSPVMPYFPQLAVDEVTGGTLPDVAKCEGYSESEDSKKKKQQQIKEAIEENEETAGS